MFIIIIVFYLLLLAWSYFQFRKNKEGSKEHGVQNGFKSLIRAKSDQPDLQLLKWSVLASLAAFLSIVPLLGLPGAMLINVFSLFELVPESKLSGDNMWPVAITLSLLMPLGWPVAIAIRNTMALFWNLHYHFLVKIVIIFWFILLLVLLKQMI